MYFGLQTNEMAHLRPDGFAISIGCGIGQSAREKPISHLSPASRLLSPAQR
jgi:hypothetical protein